MVRIITPEEVEEIRSLWDQDNLKQIDFAKLACVARSTVSRAVKNELIELETIDGMEMVEIINHKNLTWLSMAYDRLMDRIQQFDDWKNGKPVMNQEYLALLKLYNEIQLELSEFNEKYGFYS